MTKIVLPGAMLLVALVTFSLPFALQAAEHQAAVCYPEKLPKDLTARETFIGSFPFP